MEILITGGCGFVGLKLARKLLEKGHSVYLMDVDSEPLMRHRELDKVTFIPGNVTCQAHLMNALKDYGIKWVVHLAARISIPSEEDPWSTFEVNVRGMYHALEAARICSVERFVFTSSLACYGLHLPPLVNDQTIQRPIGMYGVTKVFGEQLGTFYRRRFGLDFRSIRYPQIIGPGVKAARSGSFMSTTLVIEAAVKGEAFKMTIEEDLKVPVIYYKDAIEATSCLIHAPKENVVTINYNLAEIKPGVTARRFVEVVRSFIPSAKITFVPDPLKVELAKSVAVDYDDSKLRQETGYKPSYGLERAIKEYIQELQVDKN